MTKHSEKRLSTGIVIAHLILIFECTLFINNYPKGFFSSPTSLPTKFFWTCLVGLIGILLIYTY